MSPEPQDNNTASMSSDCTSGAPDPNSETNAHLEPWVVWVKRVTHEVEAHLTNLKIDDWYTSHLKRKWKFAGLTIQRDDERWSQKLIYWSPLCIHSPKAVDHVRTQGRQKKRWHDDFNLFWKKLYDMDFESWALVAYNPNEWDSHAKDFITFMTTK